MADCVRFTINGEECIVGSDVASTTMLVDYIRKTMGLKGTKFMCREGGCGACIVTVVKCHGAVPTAVNSCLVSVTSCHGWEITTIEKVGNRLDGYHPIQKALATHNGSQCGYCSPGWVMAFYSLLRANPDRTMLDIEKSFASNICRCTGYRPILDAFKSFASDAPKSSKIIDIEDLKICDKINCEENCEDKEWCIVSDGDVKETDYIKIKLKDGRVWYRVPSVADIFKIFSNSGTDSYMLVNGNTAKGAYPIDDYPRVLIDISGVLELKMHMFDQNFILGAGYTLTEAREIFKDIAKHEYFKYLDKFVQHLDLVANIPLRNIGSIAGNLMIKHDHQEFPSDIFLLLETVGAQLTIQSGPALGHIVTMTQFLNLDMHGKVILNVLLPPLKAQTKIATFKVMPKSQNAHAIVNAGFLYKLNAYGIVNEARIVFGGLSPIFVHAYKTETFLRGKKLFSNKTLQICLNILKHELIVDEMLPYLPAAYRQQLALGLFYKGILFLYPENVQPRYQSGAKRLRESRPVSHGSQSTDTVPSLWPLNQPIPKIDGLIQCAGEAKYVNDLPCLPGEVYAALVLSTIPKGKIVSINPEEALNQKGVIAFYTAKDIPGKNLITVAEELLSTGEVKYFSQPIGIIVAESYHIAQSASKMVKVTYIVNEPPLLDIKKSSEVTERVTFYREILPTANGTDVQTIIKGDNTIYGQYHLTMETISCVTKPTEEGIAVYPTSQWITTVQLFTSLALNMNENRIDVYVQRIGGGYGMKLSRTNHVAVSCSLVTYKLNRPCRFIMPLATNTKVVGKRMPSTTRFECAVNQKGVIQYIKHDLYEDNGFIVDELLIDATLDAYYNCYDKSRWHYRCYNATTDTASNSWCRSPGTLEAIAHAETIMERISYELSLDPIQVRLSNLDSKLTDLLEMTETLKKDASYNERRAFVDHFNATNRWKKRGLRFSFMKWRPSIPIPYFDVTLSVFSEDGTIAITHGGVEMGQGLNTKAIQICAYMLQIPISKIQIKANSTMNSPNNTSSGGSLTSQSVGIGVLRCCKELLLRLEPVKAKLTNPSWETLVKQAYTDGLDLQVHNFVGSSDLLLINVYCVTLAEVEIDVLTGEYEILRVDINQDAGRSVSPEIDIGQIEGAFIMGVGYWTSEQLIYDPQTGELLSDRTWNYYVPQARDIPLDFRISLRKNSYSDKLILGSKVTGEPSTCMAVVVSFALREAIVAARKDEGTPTNKWFQIDGPYTQDKIKLLCAAKSEDYKLI